MAYHHPVCKLWLLRFGLLLFGTDELDDFLLMILCRSGQMEIGRGAASRQEPGNALALQEAPHRPLPSPGYDKAPLQHLKTGSQVPHVMHSRQCFRSEHGWHLLELGDRAHLQRSEGLTRTEVRRRTLRRADCC